MIGKKIRYVLDYKVYKVALVVSTLWTGLQHFLGKQINTALKVSNNYQVLISEH